MYIINKLKTNGDSYNYLLITPIFFFTMKILSIYIMVYILKIFFFTMSVFVAIMLKRVGGLSAHLPVANVTGVFLLVQKKLELGA